MSDIKNSSKDQERIAQTILAQLGGNMFVRMTGARHLVALNSGLQLKLPEEDFMLKDDVNCLRIELRANDTYTVEAWTIDHGDLENSKKKSTHDNIYNNQLAPLFTQLTGLSTSL